MTKNLTYHESDDRFYVKDSTIKNAGKGLFARRNILKGETLMVTGVLVERQSPADICTTYANAYKFATSPVVLGNGQAEPGKFSLIPLGYGGIVNHVKEREKMNVEMTFPEDCQVGYKFLRDVSKDEEIVGNYGDQFQSIMDWIEKERANVKPDKKSWEEFLEFNLYDLGGII